MRLWGLVVGLVLTGCGANEAVRTLSLCELGVAATRAGKGKMATTPLRANEVRPFEVTEPLIGTVGTIDVRAAQPLTMRPIAGGGLYLVAWVTFPGLSDVDGQGLFWEFAPGRYESARLFGGAITSDGQVQGGVDEETLRSELLRGAGLADLAACHQP